ncbi:MAG: OmpP1/FadL family transporter [Sandaracinaceae bacterium]
MPTRPAAAGGFYLMPRGARPMARGGAYVAGVEDPHALWYNPAGLAYSGNQLLVDATLSLFETQFTRLDSGGTLQPTATGYHAYLPIPTVGGSFRLDALPEWTFGISLQAPNAALMNWPREAEAPQRYSLLSLEGSLLLTTAIGAAWRPIDELSIGLSAHLLVGSFDATVALSACDGVICSFPEDPEYDAVANIALPVVYPFFELGGILDLGAVRVGASIATPFNLEGDARVRVRPPSAAAFSGAEVVNRRPGCDYQDETAACRDETVASTRLAFPWVARLGVEVRPTRELRVELAGVYESWSVQNEALIDPIDVWIQNALGGGLEYQVGPLSIPRNMNDTISVRLGGEYTIERVVTARLGVMYENGAFGDEWLTPLTVDSDKVMASLGVAVNVSDEFSIDAVGGYLWMAPRDVSNSRVPQSNPIRPPGAEPERVYIGNGTYQMGAPFFGLGIRWRPGSIASAPSEREAQEAPSPAATETQAPPATGAEADEAPAVPPGDDTPWYLRGESEGAPSE